MGNYAIFLEGKNFELTREGRKELFGFFVTVRVEAQSQREAEIEATAQIEADPQLASAYKSEAKITPTIEVKVVHQLPPDNKMKSTEFVFFPMDEA